MTIIISDNRYNYMKLVIVESPSKARTINKYLGKEYNVVASVGHIRDLPSKNGSVLPEEDFAMKYEIPKKAASQIKIIADMAKNADEIYLATDPDREGESISWHILEVLKQKKVLKKQEIKRVVFNEITKKSVVSAMGKCREVDIDLVEAQQARRALDYLVGFNLSPVLWRKLPGSKSAGRVQSVALRLICEREFEIEKFISQEYWDVTADMLTIRSHNFSSRLTHYDGDKLEKFSVTNDNQANDIVSVLKQSVYKIDDIQKKQQKRKPAPPFITSTMQQEAARKLGFSAKKTMQVAQKLYEGLDLGDGETVGLITYMRTDGVYLAQEAVDQMRDWIKQNLGDKYLPKDARLYKAKAKNSQEAHEAIRPTDISRSPEQMKSFLDTDQMRLYDLIWKRALACQMEDVILDLVNATIKAQDKDHRFKANGSTIAFDGFYRIYREGEDDKDEERNNLLPELNIGEDVKVEKILPNQHFTEPPPRFSEASLVKKMEELGIGRPSTTANIISVLQERKYVRAEKKRLLPEERGMLVTAFLVNYFKKYLEYDFTAKLENELDEVAEGKLHWKKLLSNFWHGFIGNIDSVKDFTITNVIDKLEDILGDHLFPTKDGEVDPRKCTKCSEGKLGLKLGRYGAFIACSNYPECKFTKQVSSEDNDSAGNGGEDNKTENKVLGNYQDEELHLKNGPYGWYVQLGDNSKKKAKRVGLPKNFSPTDLDLDKAIFLISMPKVIGKNSETDEDVAIGIGKFGPYIKHDKKFTSIPKDYDLFSINLEQAMTIMQSKKK